MHKELKDECVLNLKNSDVAMNYLINNRRLFKKSIFDFELGYLDGKLGTLGYYDKYIIVPSVTIWDETLGFFGRRINPGEPKYKKSYAYKTSDNILGLKQAWPYIVNQKFAIITEGVFDCIQAHNMGFFNAVASPGKDWDAEQLALLRRYTDTIVLIFDNDKVGIETTYKYTKEFYDRGFFVSSFTVPDPFKDLDEILKSHDVNGAWWLDNMLRRYSNT